MDTKPLTAQQLKRRAAYAKLVASFKTTPHTSIATPEPIKQKPAHGRFATS